MPDLDIIIIRHGAPTLQERYDTAKYKTLFTHKDVSDTTYQKIPHTHQASKRGGRLYSKDSSWCEPPIPDELAMLARHPSNLKAVWGINQVQEPEFACKSVGPALLPSGLAEFPGLQCPGQPNTPLYGTDFTPQDDGCLRLDVCYVHRHRPENCPLSKDFVAPGNTNTLASLATVQIDFRIAMPIKTGAEPSDALGPIFATILDSTWIMASHIDKIEIHEMTGWTKVHERQVKWKKEIQKRDNVHEIKQARNVPMAAPVSPRGDRQALPGSGGGSSSQHLGDTVAPGLDTNMSSSIPTAKTSSRLSATAGKRRLRKKSDDGSDYEPEKDEPQVYTKPKRAPRNKRQPTRYDSDIEEYQASVDAMNQVPSGSIGGNMSLGSTAQPQVSESNGRGHLSRLARNVQRQSAVAKNGEPLRKEIRLLSADYRVRAPF